MGKSQSLGYAVECNNDNTDGTQFWKSKGERKSGQLSDSEPKLNQEVRSSWLLVSANKLLGDYSGDLKAPACCLIQHCL